MKLALERPISRVWDQALRFTLRGLIRSYESYHPVLLDDVKLAAGERSCIDRWELIRPMLAEGRIGFLLDLGCAEGYFVQRAAAEFCCIAVGVDADIRRLTVARMSTSLNRIAGAGFIYGTINTDFLQKLPSADVILFLSVLHHVMYEHGVDHARELLIRIRALTSTCLIFDMGQSNETGQDWASLLPDMTPDPKAWITELLKSAGFSQVDCVGETDAYKNKVRRHLFVARP